MKNRAGFTLVEIIVAAAIFSGFMMGVFAIFSNGSTSFIAGNWKIQSQNKLRLLLEDIKSDIAKANNVYVLSQNIQTQIATTPIYINSSCYASGVSSFTTMNVMTATTFTPIMFLSVTTPRINASVFSPTAVSGKWSGSSLWAKNGKLYFTRTGNTTRYTTYPQTLPGAIVSYAAPSVSVGGNFEPSTRAASLIMEDVESIGFIQNEITDTVGQKKHILKMRISLRRTRGGKTTNTTIEESVAANIQEMTNVSAF